MREEISRGAFWTLDYLKGKRVGKHYQVSDKDFARKRVSEMQEALLKHAISSTKFYSGFAGATSLTDLPVVTKECIKARLRDFATDKYYNDRHLRPVHTSGSNRYTILHAF